MDLAVLVASARRDTPVGLKLDIRYPAALDDRCALGAGILQQDVIERGPAHLIGIAKPLVPGRGEIERDRLAVVRRDEFHAQLEHPDLRDRLLDAELLEKRHVEGEE